MAFTDYLGAAIGGLPGYLGARAIRDKGFRDQAKSWLFGSGDKDAALGAGNFQLQGGDALRNYAMGQMQGAQGRGAPSAQAAQLGPAAQLNAGPQDQWRTQQMALAQQMAGVAGGTQMGAGEMAARRQANQQAAQLAGNTMLARGGNAGIMGLAAARGLGDLGVNAAGMAAQSAMTDQANARAGLAGLLGQGRGQDLDLAGQNAAFDQQRMLQQGAFGQQTNLANLQAMLAQRGMNDQYALGMLGGATNVSAEELRARMARAGLLGQDSGHFADLLQMGGQLGVAALSDERAKTGIEDADKDVDATLAALKPYSYEYKNPAFGKGRRIGIMAQALEATPAGGAVERRGGGDDPARVIDFGKGMSFALAAVGRLDKRLRALGG